MVNQYVVLCLLMILLLLIFTYAEDIRFQVSADGTVNMVEMRNKPNTEHICMYDSPVKSIVIVISHDI